MFILQAIGCLIALVVWTLAWLVIVQHFDKRH